MKRLLVENSSKFIPGLYTLSNYAFSISRSKVGRLFKDFFSVCRLFK